MCFQVEILLSKKQKYIIFNSETARQTLLYSFSKM